MNAVLWMYGTHRVHPNECAVIQYDKHSGFVFNNRRISFEDLIKTFEYLALIRKALCSEIPVVHVERRSWFFRRDMYEMGGGRFKQALKGQALSKYMPIPSWYLGSHPFSFNHVDATSRDILTVLSRHRSDVISRICRALGDDYRFAACIAYCLDKGFCGDQVKSIDWDLPYTTYCRIKLFMYGLSTQAGNWLEKLVAITNHVIREVPDATNQEIGQISAWIRSSREIGRTTHCCTVYTCVEAVLWGINCKTIGEKRLEHVVDKVDKALVSVIPGMGSPDIGSVILAARQVVSEWLRDKASDETMALFNSRVVFPLTTGLMYKVYDYVDPRALAA